MKGRSSSVRSWQRGWILAAVLATALCTCAGAREVKITGKKCPLAFTEAAEDAQETEKKVKELTIWGVVDEEKVAVVIGGKKGFVPVSDFSQKLPLVDLSALPHVSEWTDLAVNSSGDRVRELQQHLINLTYLSGGADGVFGGMTGQALSAFQTAEGIEATGTADIFTWFALVDAGTGRLSPVETEYPTEIKAEDKFGAILDKVSDPAVLEAYLPMEWTFSYDALSREGEIRRGRTLGSFEKQDRDVDRLSMTATEVIYVYEDGSDSVQVVPAIKVSSSGAYRPCVESVLIGDGKNYQEYPLLNTSRALDGVKVQETSYVELGDEGFAQISSLEGLSIRVKGKNGDYDLVLPSEKENIIR